MSFFRHLFDELEHDAKPLLSAAAQWAETEGLKIVQEVESEVKAKAPGELVAFFNVLVGKELGFTLPATTALGGAALDLLTTALARAEAQEASGTTLRASILNAGLEQALLLLKGKNGDITTAPQPALAGAKVS